MSYKLIDGKKHSKDILDRLKQEVGSLKLQNQAPPGLLTIIVGDDKGSEIYVSMKRRRAIELGYKDFHEKFPAHFSEKELIETIQRANDNSEIHGILVQLPLPRHIDTEKVILSLDPCKDVDGFHPQNLGKLFRRYNGDILAPCTPKGVYELLLRENIDTVGKRIVVLGRSNLVGRPLAAILSQPKRPKENIYGGDASISILHSRSRKSDIQNLCSQADILIAAVGQPYFVTKDMVKAGSVIIDVGIHKVPADENSQALEKARKKGLKNYRIIGDVDFNDVKDKVAAITPVPGGVGPMTIAMLMHNTLLARHQQSV